MVAVSLFRERGLRIWGTMRVVDRRHTGVAAEVPIGVATTSRPISKIPRRLACLWGINGVGLGRLLYRRWRGRIMARRLALFPK